MKTRSNSSVALLGVLFFLCLNAACKTPSTAIRGGEVLASGNSPYDYKTRTLVLKDGTYLAYTDSKKGKETIIFIHGLGSYLPAWSRNINDLSKSYRTIAIDLPGYGRSSKEGAKVGMSHYADVILEVMDKLHVEQAVLTGHSMGGQIALTAALRTPERVKKLILAAPAGFETFSDQQKLAFKATVTPESVMNATPEQVAANYKANFHQMPADAQFMLEDRLKMSASEQLEAYSKAVAESVAAMVDEPVADRLAELDTPTLIIFGENDALIPNKYFNPELTPFMVASAGAKQIRNSKLIMLPETGHFLQFEQPALFNKAVKDFLWQ